MCGRFLELSSVNSLAPSTRVTIATALIKGQTFSPRAAFLTIKDKLWTLAKHVGEGDKLQKKHNMLDFTHSREREKSEFCSGRKSIFFFSGFAPLAMTCFLGFRHEIFRRPSHPFLFSLQFKAQCNLSLKEKRGPSCHLFPAWGPYAWKAAKKPEEEDTLTLAKTG